MRKYSIFLGSLLFILSAATLDVKAATLDFTSNPYIGSNGTIAGTTYAITAIGGPLSWGQNQDGNSCFELACEKDGLGVGDDEISVEGQAIVIDFGTTVRITSLAFLDLFSTRYGQRFEIANVQYDGGSMSFRARGWETPFGDSGFYWADGLNLFTDQLRFTASGTNDDNGVGEYALAAVGVSAVEVSAVPLPPALLMFCVALTGVGILGRRKKKSNDFN